MLVRSRRRLGRRLREGKATAYLITRKLLDLLAHEDMRTGFEWLYDYVEELAVGVPDATVVVKTFMPRLLMDNVLPPTILVREGVVPRQEATQQRVLFCQDGEV